MFGLDFSSSNAWSGAKTYGGTLHNVGSAMEARNPYYRCMKACCAVLDLLRGDGPAGYRAYRFGCVETRAERVVPLSHPFADTVYADFGSLVAAYKDAVHRVETSGPAAIAPFISALITASQAAPGVPVVGVLVTDADVEVSGADLQAVVQSLTEMSHHPVALVVAGVGDAEFPCLVALDTEVGQKSFDNLHFTQFTRLDTAIEARRAKLSLPVSTLELVASDMFGELPRQLAAMRDLGLLGDSDSDP